MEKLKFRLRDIPDSGLDLTVELPRELLASALEGIEGADLDATTGRIEGQATRIRDNVFVRGKLLGIATVACARCLEPAKVNLATKLDLTLMPEAEGAPDPDADELATSDAEFATYEGDLIDLTELVRELCVLAIPMAPVCREDCPGLPVPPEVKPPEGAFDKASPLAALKSLKVPETP